jgi:hypothetical protein
MNLESWGIIQFPAYCDGVTVYKVQSLLEAMHMLSFVYEYGYE